jgi:electron transfer flavoprotein-quinone oxidoreductase
MEKFDAIVVGAGPAGLAAAKVMAEGGLNVALIERGSFPGSKNMMGGVLYREPTEQVFPGFWKEAPVERQVIEQRVWLLTEDSAITFSHRNDKFGREPYNCFTVLRAKIDNWFAERVKQAGVLLIPETVVVDLLRSNGKVVGVRTDRPEGDLACDVVVIAEGANALLTEKLGLRRRPSAEKMACAVKEIISLPKSVIDQRFNLTGFHGITIELYGAATSGTVGTGFIYTNRESLSVGVGALISDLIEHDINPNDMIERMKAHPAVRPLLEEGETREFLAHMIPEGGYDALPKLFGDGFLVVGDAAGFVNAIHREGSNMAMISGKLAAETILRARKRSDFSARSLSQYERALKDSFIIKDLKKYRRATTLFERNRQFLALYPGLINWAAEEMMTVDSVPKKEKQSKIIKGALRQRSLLGMAKDLYSLWRSMY